jgi:hypothetical protein
VIGPTSGESNHDGALVNNTITASSDGPNAMAAITAIGGGGGGGPDLDIDTDDPDITEAADLAIKKVST